jgi:uncharacterized membrane protein YfcA
MKSRKFWAATGFVVFVLLLNTYREHINLPAFDWQTLLVPGGILATWIGAEAHVDANK